MTRKADQNDARPLFISSVRKDAKILVFGKEYANLGPSEGENLRVGCARAHFCNRNNIVTAAAECANDDEVATLVGQEAHSLAPRLARIGEEENLFVGEHFGGVSDGRLDVGGGEVRVRIQQVSMRCAFAELTEYQLDWYACPADHGLPQHNLRVDFYAIDY